MIKKLILISMLFFLASCKTFIVKGNFEWSESDYNNMGLISEYMCITNQEKNNESKPCYNKKDAVKLTQVGNTYIFSITKGFIENNFNGSKLRKAIKKDFTVTGGNTESHALILLAKFFSNTVKNSVDKTEYERKEKYINDSINSLFDTANNRLKENYKNSGIGIGFKLIYYDSIVENYSGNFALSEVFFVDINDNNKVIGASIYGYVSFFNSGHGGFNISIPTCHTKTTSIIDGCELNSKNEVIKWVRKSQLNSEKYGKSIFRMSFAKYLPPPSQPRAKGILFEF